MPNFIRTARAEDDLIDIWLYIAQDSPKAADRLLDRIDLACDRLAQNPAMGAVRPDLPPGLRFGVVGKYLILYRQRDPIIEIVRVVHGARLLRNVV